MQDHQSIYDELIRATSSMCIVNFVNAMKEDEEDARAHDDSAQRLMSKVVLVMSFFQVNDVDAGDDKRMVELTDKTW